MKPSPPTGLVGVVGLALTASLAWTARSAHEENEDRLVRQRAFEVAAVLTVAVPSIEGPLATSAALVQVEAEPETFRTVMGTQVGPDKRFVPASVWSIEEAELVAVIGEPPRLESQPPDVVQSFLDRSRRSGLMNVLDLTGAPHPRLGYGFTSPDGPADYMIYAEQALPDDRTTSRQSDAGFSDLDYATYLDSPGRPPTVPLLLASTDDLPSRVDAPRRSRRLETPPFVSWSPPRETWAGTCSRGCS